MFARILPKILQRDYDKISQALLAKASYPSVSLSM